MDAAPSEASLEGHHSEGTRLTVIMPVSEGRAGVHAVTCADSVILTCIRSRRHSVSVTPLRVSTSYISDCTSS